MPDYQISPDKLHATLLQLDGRGILFIGKSGVGKSDLALRLIENKHALLVADDVVLIEQRKQQIFGRAADNLRGMLEVRGIGIVNYPYLQEIAINLVVNLEDKQSAIERFPQNRTENILGVEIPRIDLYAKECSAVDKVCVGLLKYGR